MLEAYEGKVYLIILAFRLKGMKGALEKPSTVLFFCSRLLIRMLVTFGLRSRLLVQELVETGMLCHLGDYTLTHFTVTLPYLGFMYIRAISSPPPPVRSKKGGLGSHDAGFPKFPKSCTGPCYQA